MADPAVLMARYCDGDVTAFRSLYELVAPRLLGDLPVIGHDARATELVQLTFMNLHRARGAYIRGTDPVPWIYAIAQRVFVDEHRRRSQR